MLSILIPAYNEATVIARTIEHIQQVMDKISVEYEILVIDDGSSDNTATLAEATGVSVVRQPANGGYGRALKTGLRHARYEWCAIIDADGTYPIESFPKLLEYIPQFDMVVGARTGSIFWGSRAKQVGRFFLLRIVRFVVGIDVPDPNSGMRIFRKSIALRHAYRISSGFSFTTTLTLAMLLEEHFVKYVPIEYFPRVGKSKVRFGIDTLRMLQILVQAVLYYNPLKLFLPVCLMSVIVGVVFLLADILFDLSLGFYFIGFALLVALVVGALGFNAEVARLSRPRDSVAEDKAKSQP